MSQQINKLRRNRGYNFEYKFVNFVNKQENYNARRLGGSSTGLPDVIVTNNKLSLLYAIEAKSVTLLHAYIPNDQIMRCNDMFELFNIYKYKYIVFAFKFGINKTEYQKNKQKKKKTKIDIRTFYFKIVFQKYLENIESISCDYNGKLLINANHKLVDYKKENFPVLLVEKYEKIEDLLKSDNVNITSLDVKYQQVKYKL